MPTTPELGTTSGSADRGTSNRAHSSSDQAPFAEVVQEGAAGVAGVGDVRGSAGQPGDHVGVDRPQRERAVADALPHARLVLGEPGELGAGEVRVQAQAGELGDPRLDAVGAQPVADAGGAPVLPDDRRPGRLAGAPVPDDGGLALVGDPDAGGLRVGAGERLTAGGDGRRPDVLRLVLDPAGAGEELGELAIAAGQDVAVLTDDQRGHPGRTCVDGEDGHGPETSGPRRIPWRACAASSTTPSSSRTARRSTWSRSASSTRRAGVLRRQHRVRPRQGHPVGAPQRPRPAALTGRQGLAQP